MLAKRAADLTPDIRDRLLDDSSGNPLRRHSRIPPNYFVNDDGPAHIRISYIAAPSPADVAEGIRRFSPLL